MNPPQDQFVELRRLLSIKRYERPNPGYFEGFSREVVARIRSEQASRSSSWSSLIAWEGSWLQQAWSAIQTKPLFAGGFGLAVCGLLLAGVFLSEQTDAAFAAGSAVPVLAEQQTVHAANLAPSLDAQPGQFMGISAGLIAQPRESLFQRVNEATRVQPVSFTSPFGN